MLTLKSYVMLSKRQEAKANFGSVSNSHSIFTVLEGNEIVYRDYVDISVAVATPKVSWRCIRSTGC